MNRLSLVQKKLLFTFILLIVVITFTFLFWQKKNSLNVENYKSDSETSKLSKLPLNEFLEVNSEKGVHVNTSQEEKLKNLQTEVEKIPNVNKVKFILLKEPPSGPFLQYKWEGESIPYTTFDYKIDGNQLSVSSFVDFNQFEKYKWNSIMINQQLDYLSILGVFAAQYPNDMNKAQEYTRQFISEQNKISLESFYSIN